MSASAGREADAFDVEVGVRVRTIRKSKGVSQAALAEAAGITFQQVQKYERGANRISCSMLRRISEHLGVPMSELLGEEAGSGGVSLDWSLLAQPEVTEIAQAFASVKSPVLRRRILDLVVQLADQSGQSVAGPR